MIWVSYLIHVLKRMMRTENVLHSRNVCLVGLTSCVTSCRTFSWCSCIMWPPSLWSPSHMWITWLGWERWSCACTMLLTSCWRWRPVPILSIISTLVKSYSNRNSLVNEVLKLQILILMLESYLLLFTRPHVVPKPDFLSSGKTTAV